MKNKEQSRLLYEEAKWHLELAEYSFRNKKWNSTIRRCQEAIELLYKAFLKSLGIDFPKVHDVGSLVGKILKEKKILMDKEKIEEVIFVSRYLSEKRLPAFYGEKVYDCETAENSLKKTRKIFEIFKPIMEI